MALDYLLHAGHYFLNRFAREFHVQRIGAKVEVIVPSDGSVGSYMHLREISWLVPNFEHALSGKVRQVYLTGDAICISKPNAVASSWVC